jgi:hypothetical protein
MGPSLGSAETGLIAGLINIVNPPTVMRLTKAVVKDLVKDLVIDLLGIAKYPLSTELVSTNFYQFLYNQGDLHQPIA